MSQWNQFQQQYAGQGYTQQQIAGMYRQQQSQQGGSPVGGTFKTIYAAMVSLSDARTEVAGFSMTLDGAKKLLHQYVKAFSKYDLDIEAAVVVKTQFGKTYEDDSLYNEEHVYTEYYDEDGNRVDVDPAMTRYLKAVQSGGAYGDRKKLYVAMVEQYAQDTVFDEVAGLSMTLNGAKKLLHQYVTNHPNADELIQAVVVETTIGKTYQGDGLFNEEHVYTHIGYAAAE